jgi:two-component system nitrate/nitrite response regulator NarL
MTIRILLIDDHTLFRGGIRALLQRQTDFEIVDEASDGVEGVKRAKQHRPDVILLDLNMPGLSGLETLQLLVQDLPDSAVIMLTVSEEAEELAHALRSGARGYLVKNIETEALISAIRRAAAGEAVIADSMTAKLVAQFLAPNTPHAATPSGPTTPQAAGSLTAREREIVRGVTRGQSNKEIARDLGVTESTVKIHVQSILKKLSLSSRVQIAVYAVENKLNESD